MKLFLIIFLYIFYACSSRSLNIKNEIAEKNEFKFHLNHVDIAIDSVTFHSLLKNKFITDTFSSTKIFRDSTGIELLVRGQEHFLHFLPDKGFYTNRLGAAVLLHHNYTWRKTDTVMQYLQSFTKDSLYNRPYRSGGEDTHYIHIYENFADSLSLLKFIPQFQNFKKSDYLSWGYTPEDLKQGISQEKWMFDYVGVETKDKLFNRIVLINVTTSTDERKRIPPLLKAYGYIKKGNRYLLNGSPTLSVAPLRSSRVTTIHIKLSRPVQNRMIRISDNSYLLLKGFDAFFNYSVASPIKTNKIL
jgi:hypothetical protein